MTTDAETLKTTFRDRELVISGGAKGDAVRNARLYANVHGLAILPDGDLTRFISINASGCAASTRTNSYVPCTKWTRPTISG